MRRRRINCNRPRLAKPIIAAPAFTNHCRGDRSPSIHSAFLPLPSHYLISTLHSLSFRPLFFCLPTSSPPLCSILPFFSSPDTAMEFGGAPVWSWRLYTVVDRPRWRLRSGVIGRPQCSCIHPRRRRRGLTCDRRAQALQLTRAVMNEIPIIHADSRFYCTSHQNRYSSTYSPPPPPTLNSANRFTDGPRREPRARGAFVRWHANIC